MNWNKPTTDKKHWLSLTRLVQVKTLDFFDFIKITTILIIVFTNCCSFIISTGVKCYSGHVVFL